MILHGPLKGKEKVLYNSKYNSVSTGILEVVIP